MSGSPAAYWQLLLRSLWENRSLAGVLVDHVLSRQPRKTRDYSGRTNHEHHLDSEGRIMTWSKDAA